MGTENLFRWVVKELSFLQTMEPFGLKEILGHQKHCMGLSFPNNFYIYIKLPNIKTP